MSGVSYGSIKRFESTGQISLLALTRIATALDLADELRNLFTQVPYKDISEVIRSRGNTALPFIILSDVDTVSQTFYILHCKSHAYHLKLCK